MIKLQTNLKVQYKMIKTFPSEILEILSLELVDIWDFFHLLKFHQNKSPLRPDRKFLEHQTVGYQLPEIFYFQMRQVVCFLERIDLTVAAVTGHHNRVRA